MAQKPKSRAVEADPETRRKAIRAELDRAAGGDSTKKLPPKPEKKRLRIDRSAEKKPASKNDTTLGALLDPKRKRDRTVEGTNVGLMEAVERGVKEGTEVEKKRK